MTKHLPRIDYATHPAYGGMFEPHPVLAARALQLLEPLIQEAREIEAEKQARFGYRYGHGSSVGEALIRDGVTAVQLGGSSLAPIQQHSGAIFEGIRSRLEATRAGGDRVKYKTCLERIGPDTHPELWGDVVRAMQDCGALEVTAAYFGAAGAKVRSAGLLLNQPDQDWVTRLYRDIEMESPPTVGFHIDSNGKCLVKAVLYLNAVGPEQGPFGMVPGSHRWDEGSDDRIFRRAFDKSELPVRSAKKRRMFLSLPPQMQVKAEFGGDMLADSAEAKALVDEEFVATGPGGQLNLFDPEGIHRGGGVRSGERRVMLITIGASW